MLAVVRPARAGRPDRADRRRHPHRRPPHRRGHRDRARRRRCARRSATRPASAGSATPWCRSTRRWCSARSTCPAGRTACTPASRTARRTSPSAATGRYLGLADPARLRDARLPRADRAARAGAVRPRPAPPRRGAVQGVRPGVPRRGRARPARDRRALHQGHVSDRPQRVVVLDYGSGNLRSAVRALERAGAEVDADRRPRGRRGRRRARRARRRRVRGLHGRAAGGRRAARSIGRRLAGGRPVLGICVGMQVLFERGVEHGVETEGCDEWPGVVERLQAPVVPHMGWNTVEVARGLAAVRGRRAGAVLLRALLRRARRGSCARTGAPGRRW